MADQAHVYENTVEWGGDRRGVSSTAGRMPIATGAPPEFGGSPDVWAPEHLCVAAVNACVMLTFVTVAANSKVPIEAYTSAATGTLEKIDARGPVITRIVVKPRIAVGAGVDHAKVERLVKMAERNCYISNSLKAEVLVEAEIVSR